jgi:hypothetical protein
MTAARVRNQNPANFGVVAELAGCLIADRRLAQAERRNWHKILLLGCCWPRIVDRTYFSPIGDDA